MKCSVYIATSIDGFIASKDGGVDWLHTAGKPDADMGAQADMGFESFMASVDCLVMGRGCMEAISGFDLAPDEWPYGDARVIVLTTTLKAPPANLKDRVELYSGDVRALVASLDEEGYRHIYVDGGKTIQSFLELGLIDEMTLTRAPVLLGEGIPLFGNNTRAIRLTNARATAFPNDFVQLRYSVVYD